jgi:hypothetical protein
METGEYQNEIDILKDIEKYRYENLFKLYTTGDKNFYFYNILKKLKLPDTMNERLFDKVKFTDQMPITTLSFRIYGTTYLWWIIMIVNNITNPAEIESGREIKYIKKAFLKPVLDSIQQQLQ